MFAVGSRLRIASEPKQLNREVVERVQFRWVKDHGPAPRLERFGGTSCSSQHHAQCRVRTRQGVVNPERQAKLGLCRLELVGTQMQRRKVLVSQTAGGVNHKRVLKRASRVGRLTRLAIGDAQRVQYFAVVQRHALEQGDCACGLTRLGEV